MRWLNMPLMVSPDGAAAKYTYHLPPIKWISGAQICEKLIGPLFDAFPNTTTGFLLAQLSEYDEIVLTSMRSNSGTDAVK